MSSLGRRSYVTFNRSIMANPSNRQPHSLHTQVALMLALAALLLAAACTSAPVDDRPNIILVITDDQGYGEVAAHGNSMIQTPNLDALHAESVRLTNFHVDPTCSPTRSALITGRYSSRPVSGTRSWGARSSTARRLHLPTCYRMSATPQASSANGTSATARPTAPIDRGFEEAVYHGGGGVGQTPDYWGNDYFDDTYWHNGDPTAYEGYCTDVFFDNALRFIEETATSAENPFFVYLSTNAPHGTVFGRRVLFEAVRGQGRSQPDGQVLRHDREHRRQHGAADRETG